MKNMRPFEIGLIAFFGVAAVAALIALSVWQSGGKQEDQKFGNKVEIWGTLDGDVFENYIAELSKNDKSYGVVSYTEVDERYFEDTLVNAIAEGRSPDMIILSHPDLVNTRTKLYAIPYESYSERTYTDAFVDGANIFMLSDGIYGIPFAVDPLLMYWNRDMFSSAGLASEPRTWEEIVSKTTQALVSTDNNRSIRQAALSFGEYRNVSYAKDILAMLMLQSGTNIVEENTNGYTVTMNKRSGSNMSPVVSALSFYTQFALPNENLYTWNRAMANDTEEFLAGNLGLYFAPGSERKEIDEKNPNLFYGTAVVPQGAGATVRRTYGEFYAFAFPKASQNLQGAYVLANTLAAPQFVGTLVDRLNLAPVQRSLYNNQQTDSFKGVLLDAGLTARGWLDPEPTTSGQIFKDMIEKVTSGNTKTSQITSNAVSLLETSF